MVKRQKSPQEKKRLSLAKDRRNTYGENTKSSRKNIPRSKALAHRSVRRKATVVEQTWERLPETHAEAQELTLVTAQRQKCRFQKCPDTALGEYIERQIKQRLRRQATQKADE